MKREEDPLGDDNWSDDDGSGGNGGYSSFTPYTGTSNNIRSSVVRVSTYTASEDCCGGFFQGMWDGTKEMVSFGWGLLPFTEPRSWVGLKDGAVGLFNLGTSGLDVLGGKMNLWTPSDESRIMLDNTWTALSQIEFSNPYTYGKILPGLLTAGTGGFKILSKFKFKFAAKSSVSLGSARSIIRR